MKPSGVNDRWFGATGFIRTMLGLLAFLVVIGFVLSYVAFQARFLITGPRLTWLEEPPLVVNELFVTLSGRAENITRISLNGRTIFTDQDGYFKEEMMLENGYTIATVAATDRYGRTTTLSREFTYVPASVLPSTVPEVDLINE